MADSIITMFAFSAADPVGVVAKFADVIQWRNEHGGEWPPLPTEARIMSGTLNGLANMRSEPLAVPETLITAIVPGNSTGSLLPPFEIVDERDGYYGVKVWLWKLRVDVK